MRSNESEWAVAYTELFKMGRRTLFKIEFSENMLFKPVYCQNSTFSEACEFIGLTK